MGQRTQILIIRENKEGRQSKQVIHSQWGYGRVMYLDLMDLVISDYQKDSWLKVKEIKKEGNKEKVITRDFDFLKDVKINCNQRESDITEEIHEEVLEKADTSDLSSIKEVFMACDNNNGGLVVYIRQNEEGYGNSRFTIGFLLGESDERPQKKAFSRWLTPVEYGRMNDGSDYSDERFIEMFEGFCRYFNVDYFRN